MDPARTEILPVLGGPDRVLVPGVRHTITRATVAPPDRTGRRARAVPNTPRIASRSSGACGRSSAPSPRERRLDGTLAEVSQTLAPLRPPARLGAAGGEP